MVRSDRFDLTGSPQVLRYTRSYRGGLFFARLKKNRAFPAKRLGDSRFLAYISPA
jgi:hypothetical protein